jgi:3-dehydroquinate synthase
VAIGMLIACDIAQSLGILQERGLTEKLEKTLIKFNLPVYYRALSEDLILRAMGYDKKSENRKNRWVLPLRTGKITVETDVPALVILDALRKRKR